MRLPSREAWARREEREVDVDEIVRRTVQRCTPLLAAKPVDLRGEVVPGMPPLRSGFVPITRMKVSRDNDQGLGMNSAVTPDRRRW